MDRLPVQASRMAADKLSLQLSTSVLKQSMDQQQTEAEALVKMMQWSPTSGSVGQNVNVLA